MININEVPDNPSGFSRHVSLITKHDTNVLDPIPIKGIKIGSTAGDLVFEPYDRPGVTITLPVAAFEHVAVIPRIIKTATTAATLHGYA